MKLGTYKGLHAVRPYVTVEDREIDNVLKNKQQEYSVVYHIDHRPAQLGDQAVLDFKIECEGQAVPQGESQNYPLLLGSHTFVKGFEEAIVGHETGDCFDVTLTFPAEYRIPSLRGKDVVYHVHLKALQLPEYQEIDDDFARDFSPYNTLEEWKAEIRANLEERREASSYERLSRDLLNQIIADSEIPVDPEIKEELSMELLEDFLYELEAGNMTFEKYCKRTGKNKQQIRAEKDAEAEQTLCQQTVLHAIAAEENLQISDEELQEALAFLAAEEGEEPEEFSDSLGEEELEGILDQLSMNKAMEFILEHVIFDE